MNTFLQIVNTTVSGIGIAEIKKPIFETGIDSIDLVVIRVGLEKHYGFPIPDMEWYSLNTLEQVYFRFTSNIDAIKEQPFARKAVELEKQIEITMPQMANSALSESWLLKEQGNIHWSLLSDGLEIKSSELKDETGNRLYATFTRITYSCSPLTDFKENDIIHFKGSIKRFGNSVYLSEINGKCEDANITATLMTSFSVRSENDNSKIQKGQPKERINHIEELKSTPDFLNDYRLLRKNLVDAWKSGPFEFPLKQENIFTTQYHLNPYYDINGVGLLYFATYPIIADISLNSFFNERLGKDDWIEKYQTVCRDIYYFANCNAKEIIIVSLNNFKVIDKEQITVAVTLSRQSDNVTLARIFTVKKIN